MTNKEKYTIFCEQNDFVPIFSQPWWMDAVCIDGYWDVLLYEKNEEILGALPYYVKKRWGISYITQPEFTQNNGVVIKYPQNQKYEKKLSYEKEVMTALIEQLEGLSVAFYQQAFNCRYTNWLPFYWKGYSQSTSYTYRIEDITEIDKVLENFDYSKKKNINKALKSVDVSYDLSAEQFYENHKISLEKQNDTIGYSFKLFKRIYDAAYSHGKGKVICCRDKEKNIHVALFVIWDAETAYDLISTIDPEYRNSGAASLAVYEIIKYVKTQGITGFDFEGSMIEGVENSFRKFCTVQTPYFFICKIMTKNPLLRILIDRKLRETR